MSNITIEDMASFCKKKGFIYPNSEVYGGVAGLFDYGPLGVELKNNIKQHWWKTFVQDREDIAGIDGTIITHPKVWEASGHVTSFTDLFVDCKKCKERYRADHLVHDVLKVAVDGVSAEDLSKIINENKIKCKKCMGELTEVRKFNLMFKTNVGPIEGNISYLRPETAQEMFTNFKLVAENSRLKLPFGIAQIGRAFRNEIAPRDFLFRTREFEQMEIEFFVHPKKVNNCHFIKEVENMKVNILSAEMQKKKAKHEKMKIKEALAKKIIKTQWHAYWLALNYKWFLDLGIKEENLRLREHLKDELAHYANGCFDIEYNFPFGWKEIQGNADRTQFDLNQHTKFSNKDLTIFDEETKEKVIPYVASEPSQGVDRAFLAFIFDAYEYDKSRDNIVLKLSPLLSPYKVAVFPLVSNKLNITKKAREVFELLRKEFRTFYDDGGSIGRRYSRQDEIGTVVCCTIDFDTLKNKSVTLRHRDTTKQIRVPISKLKDAIQGAIKGKKFEKLGKIINTRIK